jgi:hypothetical protein
MGSRIDGMPLVLWINVSDGVQGSLSATNCEASTTKGLSVPADGQPARIEIGQNRK